MQIGQAALTDSNYLLECTNEHPPMTYILRPKGDGGMYKVGQVIREYVASYADSCDKDMPLALANIIEYGISRGVEEMTVTGIVKMKKMFTGETYDKELTFRLYKEERSEYSEHVNRRVDGAAAVD